MKLRHVEKTANILSVRCRTFCTAPNVSVPFYLFSVPFMSQALTQQTYDGVSKSFRTESITK